MSIIFMDGFDTYNNNTDLSFRYQLSNGVLRPSGGRYGGGAVELTGFSGGFNYFALVSEPNEIWLGFAINIDIPAGGPYNGSIFEFVSPSGTECYLSYNQLTLVFQIHNSATNAVLATSGNSILITSGTWHWIDIHFKISSGAGICEVWVDNRRIMNATSLNTSSRGGTVISSCGWGSIENAGLMNFMFDDITVIDPAVGSVNIGRVGDSRICTTVPNSDASPNNGTPSTSGPHYAMVDEAQWSASDNITLTNVSGQEEQFGVTALPVHPATIAAIQVVAIAEKTDAGTANAKLLVTSGGTLSLGASQGVLSPYNYLGQIFEQDPNISAAWVEATVNAVKIGYQVQ